MGKLDKRVLKVLSSQEDVDYDVGDISIALKCDDDDVEDALDSLKDQGLIEAVIHNGKKFWKPARSDSFSSAGEADVSPQPQRDESSIDLLILDQPAKSLKPQAQPRYQYAQEQPPTLSTFEQTTTWRPPEPVYQRPASQAEQARDHSFEHDFAEGKTQVYTPPQKIKPAPAPAPVLDDDDDFEKPRGSGLSIASMVIAVLLSAGISAVISFGLTSNAAKNFNGTIAGLEGKVTDSGAKLAQRIDALSLAIDNIKKDMAAKPPAVASAAPVQDEVKKPPVKSASKRAVKSSRSSAAKKSSPKRAAASSKKRKTPAEMIQETSAAAGTGESSSSAAAEASSPSSADPSSGMSNPSASSEPSPAASSESSPASDPSSSASPAGDAGSDAGSPPPSDAGAQ
jgi:hypothetical protein